MIWRWRQADPRDLQVSQSNLVDKLQASDRPCLQNPRGTVTEEQWLRLTSGLPQTHAFMCTFLSTHIHTNACTCAHVCTHQHTHTNIHIHSLTALSVNTSPLGERHLIKGNVREAGHGCLPRFQVTYSVHTAAKAKLFKIRNLARRGGCREIHLQVLGLKAKPSLGHRAFKAISWNYWSQRHNQP